MGVVLDKYRTVTGAPGVPPFERMSMDLGRASTNIAGETPPLLPNTTRVRI
jgi:hypothetical protein